MYQEDTAGTVKSLRRAIRIAQEGKFPEWATTARMGLCMYLIQQSGWQEALEVGLSVLAELKAGVDREREKDMRFVLADIYKELGQHRKSAEQYEELLRQARAANAPRTLMIELLMKAGSAWRAAGVSKRAGNLFREAMPLADAETSRPLGAVARLNLATLARESGGQRQAIALTDEALRGAPDELRPLLLLVKGEAHASLKQWMEAVLAFKQALVLARQRGDAEQEASLLARLSMLTERGKQEAAAAN